MHENPDGVKEKGEVQAKKGGETGEITERGKRESGKRNRRKEYRSGVEAGRKVEV